MWWLLGLYIIVLDQISKDLIPDIVINRGLSFGFLSGRPLLANSLYLVFSILVAGIFYKTYDGLKFNQKVAWIFILSGIISSLIDRVRFGYVIDYMTVSGQLPTFNLADAAIVFGAIMLAIFYSREKS